MASIATISNLLDAVRDAAQALHAADAAVHQASLDRAAAEKVFLTRRAQLNSLLADVVARAEQGADWTEDSLL